MKWSEEQVRTHEESAERFRESYVKRENKTTLIEEIVNNNKRCATLIEPLFLFNLVTSNLTRINSKIKTKNPGFYFQEIPHFTIDCHRYGELEDLPTEIITPEELDAYDKVLSEQIRRTRYFPCEIKGVAFGGEGLVTQVWYDDRRIADLTDKLGETVRREIPSMDFIWGMVKYKIPIRVVNLTRFTGEEDRKEVLNFIDKNRHIEFGRFEMNQVNLVLSDHYVQKKNTKSLKFYNFSK